jgi:outer membrane biosynthesis protein TonB
MELTLMKLVGVISTAVLSLTLGAAVPAYAWQDQKDQQEEQKAKPAQDDKQAQQDKSAKPAKSAEKPDKSAKPEKQSAEKQDKTAKPEKQNAEKQDKTAKPEKQNAEKQDETAKPEKPSAQQQDKSAKAQKKAASQQDRNAKAVKQNAQPHTQQAEAGKQAQRGGNGGGRIPEDRFQANFGEQHTFRVTQSDYSSGRSFQQGGYSFGFVDPWPSNWLYTQNVFIIELDGVYYLCNSTYPGVNVTLSVVL